MSTEIMSQNEIDALLSALSTGEMNAEELKKEQEERKVKVYDFKRALRFSKDQIRSITRIHENFARLLTTYFSAQLRTYIQISVASVDQLPYEEFIRSIPKMTILNVFEVTPLEGRVVLEINPTIAYAMLDRQLGGKGSGVNKVDSLTEIETRLMTTLFEGAIENFGEAWDTITEMQPKLSDLEVNPQFLQMVSPNETVIVISMNITIGEVSGVINICIPYVVLEPIIPKLSAHYWMEEKHKVRQAHEQESLEKVIRATSLIVTAELGKSEISFSDLLNINIGDVIPLDQKIDKPINIKVDNKPSYFAQVGQVKKHLAIQIMEKIKEGYEDDE
ncbi:flagellar motor switch protein FliM [Sutcliffiella rhizosphaerae]|uniref:Flagellar motor switch protein FliM n=1 Tax=Sutcliffiella rhizosphaerae TaxID=2880967 RepID=A0ABM8YIS5_9BACI|nr:flagellar motor switch protein FliM [Sutcliffiella rhizosphaerae]CAG9619703.1 Flagellar motor switch protein FliM [Sutcliffiella rhizosphaerae]